MSKNTKSYTAEEAKAFLVGNLLSHGPLTSLHGPLHGGFLGRHKKEQEQLVNKIASAVIKNTTADNHTAIGKQYDTSKQKQYSQQWLDAITESVTDYLYDINKDSGFDISRSELADRIGFPENGTPDQQVVDDMVANIKKRTTSALMEGSPFEVLNAHLVDRIATQDDAFDYHDKKLTGESDGAIKKRKEDEALFMIKPIDIKKEMSNSDALNELVSAALYSRLLGNKAPKILPVIGHHGQAAVGSKFIPEFQSIYDYLGDHAQLPNDIGRIEAVVAAATFLGDYDIHSGNLGIVTSSDRSHHTLAKIDHGKALGMWSATPEALALNFIDTIDKHHYKEPGKTLHLNLSRFRDEIASITSMPDQEFQQLIYAQTQTLKSINFPMPDEIIYEEGSGFLEHRFNTTTQNERLEEFGQFMSARLINNKKMFVVFNNALECIDGAMKPEMVNGEWLNKTTIDQAFKQLKIEVEECLAKYHLETSSELYKSLSASMRFLNRDERKVFQELDPSIAIITPLCDKSYALLKLVSPEAQKLYAAGTLTPEHLAKIDPQALVKLDFTSPTFKADLGAYLKGITFDMLEIAKAHSTNNHILYNNVIPLLASDRAKQLNAAGIVNLATLATFDPKALISMLEPPFVQKLLNKEKGALITLELFKAGLTFGTVDRLKHNLDELMQKKDVLSNISNAQRLVALAGKASPQQIKNAMNTMTNDVWEALTSPDAAETFKLLHESAQVVRYSDLYKLSAEEIKALTSQEARQRYQNGESVKEVRKGYEAIKAASVVSTADLKPASTPHTPIVSHNRRNSLGKS